MRACANGDVCITYFLSCFFVCFVGNIISEHGVKKNSVYFTGAGLFTVTIVLTSLVMGMLEIKKAKGDDPCFITVKMNKTGD